MRSQFPLLYSLMAAGSLSLLHGTLVSAETVVRGPGRSHFVESAPTVPATDHVEYLGEPIYHSGPSYVMEGPHSGKVLRPHLRHGFPRPHAGLHLGMHKKCHPLHTMDIPNPWHSYGGVCSSMHGCGEPVIGGKWGKWKLSGLGAQRKLMFGGMHHGLRHGGHVISDSCGCHADSGVILGSPYDKGSDSTVIMESVQPMYDSEAPVPATPGSGDAIPVPPDPDAT